MRSIRTYMLASAIIAALAAPSPCPAFDAAKAQPAGDATKAPPNPLTRKPPNPLLNDPFVGEFEGEGMTVILKSAADGYEGEIRRAGQTFPLKAKRKDKQVTGAFTLDAFSYDFSIALDGASLRFITDEKPFTLKRKEQAPTPPAVGETPSKRLPDPIVRVPDPLPPPVAPEPTKGPKTLLAPPAAKIDYATLPVEKMRLLTWSRFPAGTAAEFEMVAATTSVITDAERRRATWEGVIQGKASLKLQNLLTDGWTKRVDHPIPTESAERIDDLGFTSGEPKDETLAIEGANLRCRRTTYTAQGEGQAGPMTVTVDIWRSGEIDIPTLSIDLPQKRLLVEPDMAKVQVTVDFKNGGKAEMSQQIESLRRDFRIDGRTVSCALVTTRNVIAKGTARIERTGEHLLTHQVPGGAAQSIQTENRGPNVLRTITTMVNFSTEPAAAPGTSKP